MKILQTVVVKQVLTEMSKQALLEKYEANKQRFYKEAEQLRFELKKLEKTKKFQQTQLMKHFDKEIQMRQEKMKLLDFQMEQLHILPIGSELKESEVQAVVDVKEGDKWHELTGKRTIIIKDGIVDEIR